VAIHLLTLAISTTLLISARPRQLKGLTIAVLVCAMFELVYITARASLALPSHFAISTAFTSRMYTLMGIGAVTLTLSAAVLGVWIVRDARLAQHPFLHWAIGVGLVLGAVLGTVSGFFLSGHNSHWVGGTLNDAAGSWLFHWSRDGGDLRVAHFFGLHAIQILPIGAWLAWRFLRRQTAPIAFAVICVAYIGFTASTLVQALGGQPFAAGVL
jgi:hypothetical protein